MTLAYVFWHAPSEGLPAASYEASLRAFHETLNVPSASFRLTALPFAARPGYEDWYLVEGWTELGELNAAAVSDPHRASHDVAARLSGYGWGGVYALRRGPARPPRSALWMTKPPEQSYENFLDSVRAPCMWQRQMVLGPAPEFCVSEDAQDPGPPNAEDRLAIVYRP